MSGATKTIADTTASHQRQDPHPAQYRDDIYALCSVTEVKGVGFMETIEETTGETITCRC